MSRARAIPLAAAAALACAAASPALAQQYRCVDSAGKVSYSDKGGPGCTQQRAGPAAVPAQPGAAAPKPPAGATKAPREVLDAATAQRKAAGKPAATPPQPPETAAQAAARCTATRQEYDWLKGPRGEGAPGREARLAQMQKALASCP